jgi:hypothetical protein
MLFALSREHNGGDTMLWALANPAFKRTGEQLSLLAPLAAFAARRPLNHGVALSYEESVPNR